MADTIYSKEPQLNKTFTSDIEAPFLDLNISNVIITTTNYDRRDNFDFASFPFLDGDVPRAISYGVCISQLIRLTKASGQIHDFNKKKIK